MLKKLCAYILFYTLTICGGSFAYSDDSALPQLPSIASVVGGMDGDQKGASKDTETPQDTASDSDSNTPVIPTPYMDDQLIVIGTAPVTGVYYPAGGAMCRLVNHERQTLKLRCAVEATPGSIYNLKALRNAEFDLAIVQSDWQKHAFLGDADPFKGRGPFVNLRFIFSLYNEAMTMVVTKDSSIKKLDDIAGKIVNIGAQGSGVRATMETLMQVKGWTEKTFKSATELTPNEQVQALCNGTIDVMVLATGHPSGDMQDAAGRCEVRMLNLDDASIRQLVASHSEFSMTTIPGGLYNGIPQDVKTFGVKATVVTTTDTSTEIVYDVTKAIFENLDDFKKLHPVFHSLTSQTMIFEGSSAPMHPGAIKYYKEKGYIK